MTNSLPASSLPAAESAASAAVRAFEYTKSAIIRGDFAAGAAISEGIVCRALDVSRTPVHEAFLRLASEELLSLESRKGAVVRPMSPSEAADVLEMREAVEAAAAARLIANGVGEDVLRTLTNLLEVQSAAVESRDVERFLQADDEFHLAIVAAAGNPVALHFIGLLRDRQQRLRYQLLRVRPEQLVSGFEQHRQLAAAIEAEDAEQYARVLREHVSSHRGAL